MIMAVWRTSFHRILNKGMGLYSQTPFYLGRLFHSYKIQRSMRDGKMFNCLHRNQTLHPLSGCSIHRQFYLGCGESKQKKIEQMCSKEVIKTIKCRPYAKVTEEMIFWCRKLWPEFKNNDWSKELKKRKKWTVKKIEDSAVRNFKTLSYNQTMDTICFCVKFHSYICHDLLSVFLESVGSNMQKDSMVWDPKSVSQLMFCVFVYGYTSEPVFRQVEKGLENHLEEYSLFEAEMVLSAFKRCGMIFTSFTVIQTFWSLFFRFCDLEPSHPQYTMPSMYLRQMSRYMSYLNSVEQLQAIGNYGCSVEKVECLITVIMCLSSAKFHHAKFVHHVIEQIENSTRRGSSIRIKSLAILCEFVANYGLDESETYTHCFDNLLTLYELSSDMAPMSKKYFPVLKVSSDGKRRSDHILHQSDDIFSPLKLVTGMMIAGKFPSAVISRCFSASARGNRKAFSFEEYGLQLLQTCIDIEYPDYKGHQMTRFMLEETATDKLPKDLPSTQKNYLQNLVWTSVKNIMDVNLVHNHKLLPYANKVMEIRLDEENRPTTFDPVPYHKLPSTFKHSHIGIAILVYNKRQTTYNGGYPLGMLRLQKRHLKILGYNVIEVPVLSIKELKSDDAERNMTDMLRNKLEKDCNVVLEEGRTQIL
ncbi:uncharacterized protein LOC110451084 [Mizuhopecten yessoensis]|uniref:FAST kinase domain-containing protein 3 n=1 Tax=Mizuhopecten yessoensis TaxID=6573 RepID=A0A210QMK5_MIZYE|nr:uncharacterized protein LOC110451084 [Mizuhopecten yessoensis]OWF49941.1 FAST kinase domain-containing protein 3 [Mizuhopecten yessoensis]